MELFDLVADIRDHYVSQFAVFTASQRRLCASGGSEVKLKLHADSPLFMQLYCVDYIDKDQRVIELQPDTFLQFDQIEARIETAELVIEQLRWNDCVILHDLKELSGDDLKLWFQNWFDPEDARHVSSASICETIHFLLVETSSLSIDFGTARPDAFWDILGILANNGALKRHVTTSQSRDEARN
jgi:hypothetical protein